MHRKRSEIVALFSLCMLLGACVPAGLPSPDVAPDPPIARGEVETGTHWADIADFSTLKNLGYQFVITMVSPFHREEWPRTFDAAQAAGIKMIVGVYPAPYSLDGEHWTVSSVGREFLTYAASRASLVKGVYVYNEPYWVNPFTKVNDPCGALSAARLRGLRTAIRAVWQDAKIYHDIGWPTAWAPGGFLIREHPCIGDKYADATGIADFVGIWFYPFEVGRDRRADALAVLRREAVYVRSRMQAQPIIAAQGFGCVSCDDTRMPTREELRDWNCATRALGPEAISWYPWRQSGYDDYLSNHPEMWSSTGPAVCK